LVEEGFDAAVQGAFRRKGTEVAEKLQRFRVVEYGLVGADAYNWTYLRKWQMFGGQSANFDGGYPAFLPANNDLNRAI